MIKIKGVFLYYSTKLKNIGITGLAQGAIEIGINLFLYFFFRFDYWHVGAAYHLKPYKKQVVDIVNSISPDVVVEVGVGLGDILSRTSARNRVGIDFDLNVIKAARFIHRKIYFICGSLNQLDDVVFESNVSDIDILVMCNWLHNVKFNEIKKSILDLQSKVSVKYLLIDLINADVSGYTYKHTVDQCKDLGNVVNIVRSNDNVRNFALIHLDLTLRSE